MNDSRLVCVAGMHRSGTSMVARLLHACGLFLGSQEELMGSMPDNPEGFWENEKFVAINDRILSMFGGAWDYPPHFPPDWLKNENLGTLREEARALLATLASNVPAGWKDPRNSLTLPFWDSLTEGFRVVVCVRNPLEVAVSLQRRNYLSYPLSLNLWKIYNQRLLDAVPLERRVVTHYASYFEDPQRELRRVLNFLGIAASDEKISGACSHVLMDLRHNRFAGQDLATAGASIELTDRYAALCSEAGFSDPMPASTEPAPATWAHADNEAEGIERVGEPAVRQLQFQESLEAHQQLIRRLEKDLDERTAWAKKCDDLVAECVGTIRRLEGELASQTAVSSQYAEGITGRDASIRQLQEQLEQEVAKTTDAIRDLTSLDATVRNLQDALQEQARSARDLIDELEERDKSIRDLHVRLEAQSAAAQQSAIEHSALDETIRGLQKEVAERTAHEDLLSRQVKKAGTMARDLQTLVDREQQEKKRLGNELHQRKQQILTMQKHIDEIEPLRRETAALRHMLRQQTIEVDALGGMVELLLKAGGGAQHPELEREIQRRQHMREIRKAVGEHLPASATVLVVSGGNDELLNIGAQPALHFPQSESGDRAEPMPSDSLAAIAHLEALRAKGAEFLLFPEAAPECLAQLPGFHQHLNRHYRLILRGKGCGIFQLCRQTDSGTLGGLAELIKECEDRLARVPSILDWNTRVDIAAAFPECMVFSPSGNDKVLPYADQSVDIIALAAKGPESLEEAHRVASAAVVTITPSEGLKVGFSMEVHWKLERNEAAFPSTSIIIPTYNGVALLGVCLRALKETLPADVRTEIIVADDGSTDTTVKFLRDWAKVDPRVKTVRAKRNAGFIATCNLGMKAATGDILVFLNNDTVPLPGWLTPLLRTFRDHPDAGAVGGRLIYPTGRLQEAGGVIFSDSSGANFGRNDPAPGAPLYSFVREVDYCSGALLATPRALCTKLGGFDPHYAPAYYEDTDYCFRVRKAGLRVYYQPASSIVHLEGATSGVDPTSGAKRFQAINHAKFMKRWKSVLKKQPRNPGRYNFEVWHDLAVRNGSNGGLGK